MIDSVSVCGAGTMGSGIAQIIAQSGLRTILFDVDVQMVDKAKVNIKNNLDVLVLKNKLTPEQSLSIYQSIHFTSSINDCKTPLIIEAIVEKLEAKASLFNQLASINKADCIFASNTSSLSISLLQQKILFPDRVVGLHFFNPATIMKLVEVVKGKETNDITINQILEFCSKIHKTYVLCQDAPGFIVNRIARHYYLESMKIVGNHFCELADTDTLLENAGFKLGPFKLMDMIGMDINLSVTTQLYEAFNHAERFKPSPLQELLVSSGKLGKKTGEGFYKYSK